MGNHWSDDGPERIYLQPALDADEEGRTWCRDAIHTPDELRCPDTEPTDTPYIREDLHLSALAVKDKECGSALSARDEVWRDRLEQERESHSAILKAQAAEHAAEMEALRRELAPHELVLIQFNHPRLIGEPCMIHVDFRPSIERICHIAEDCDLQLYITHSVRRLDQVLENTVVKQALRSNHHAGSAVDLNVVCDGEWFNSKRLHPDAMTVTPEGRPVKRFIRAVQDDETLRWGGDFFKTPDPVHFDDDLVNRDPEEWLRRVTQIREEQ